MSTPDDFMELAQERREALLRELAVIDKFIEDYGPAVAGGLRFTVPADTPTPPAPKPGATTLIDDPAKVVPPYKPDQTPEERKRFLKAVGGSEFGDPPDPPAPKPGAIVYVSPEEAAGWIDGAERKAKARPRKDGKPAARPWTPQEDERLLESRRLKFAVRVIADHLERTPAAVTARIAKLEAGAKPSREWTADEDDLLQLLYVERRETMAVIASKLGRTKHAIRHHLSKLGLCRDFTLKPGPKESSKTKPVVHAPTMEQFIAERPAKKRAADPVRKPLVEPSPMNAWTEKEDKVLTREWNRGRMSNYMLAKTIGKPAPEIARRGRQLKLGTRTRVKKTRKCMMDGCDNRFEPKDWTKDWYCEPHRLQMRHKSEPLMPQDPRSSFRESARS